MALYKYANLLTQSTDAAFDRQQPPGGAAPWSGIYRCPGCGREIAANERQPLPWPHHQGVFTVIGWILAAWLVAGMAAARRVPGVWLAVAWIAAGVGVMAALQIQYTLATGNSFLQGRYFFFLLGPFVWLAAHAVQRVARVAIPLALLGAAVLSGAVVNATLARYYHANIGTYLAGRVVAFGPPSVLALGPVALSVVGLGALVLAMGAVTSRAS